MAWRIVQTSTFQIKSTKWESQQNISKMLRGQIAKIKRLQNKRSLKSNRKCTKSLLGMISWWKSLTTWCLSHLRETQTLTQICTLCQSRLAQRSTESRKVRCKSFSTKRMTASWFLITISPKHQLLRWRGLRLPSLITPVELSGELIVGWKVDSPSRDYRMSKVRIEVVRRQPRCNRLKIL